MRGRRRGDDGSTELPTPAASRLQKPSWRDARLLVGLLLVLAATLGGASVISHLDDTVSVYRARSSLVPGQQVSKDDLQVVRVKVDQAGRTYLADSGKAPAGHVLREVRAGELVPRSAVGTARQVRGKSVAVPVDSTLAESLVNGSVVDVWVSARKDVGGRATYATPVKAIGRAVVSRVPQQRGGALGVSSGQDVSVHVLVPDDRVSAVIGAVTSESRVTLVPTAGSPMKGDA